MRGGPGADDDGNGGDHWQPAPPDLLHFKDHPRLSRPHLILPSHDEEDRDHQTEAQTPGRPSELCHHVGRRS